MAAVYSPFSNHRKKVFFLNFPPLLQKQGGENKKQKKLPCAPFHLAVGGHLGLFDYLSYGFASLHLPWNFC